MLLSNPKVLDESAVSAEITGGKSARIQFSEPEAYNPEILSELNTWCERFGPKLILRFFGHYLSEFDGKILHHLPAVRTLIIDVTRAKNIEYIGQLRQLEQLGLGVFEGDYPEILRASGIQRVHSLTLIDNRHNNVDLAPLSQFSNLTELVLCAHARHIEVLAQLGSIRRLALNKVKKTVSLSFIRPMAALRDLTILLGGRTGIDEISHEQLERLRIDRVRGIERVNLASFPALSRFHMEDQLRVPGLDLAPVQSTLRSLTIWNCKTLGYLRGVEKMTSLEHLWISKTKVNPESMIPLLPASLREVTFAGFSKSHNAAIRSLLDRRGFSPAGYVG